MKRFFQAPLHGVSLVVVAASLLTACGGGGGSNGATPPVGSGGGGSTPTSSSSPPPPSATGQMALASNPLANAIVVFTCGCTGEAGELHADASGNYTITVPATAVPASSAPYTPPGHNLMLVGYQSSGHGQAWSMEFFGSTPSHNLNLYGSNAANVSDVYTTATALYIYYETYLYYASNPSSDNTYDIWNFNTISSFAQSLHASGGNNTQEKTLIADITSAQSAGQSLYPLVPHWDPGTNDVVNSTIVADIKGVSTSGDAQLPQICGTSCGGPTP